jgi:hypothetical protein
MIESESVRGWNDTCVLIGCTVRVRAAGFGRHCLAKVLEFKGHPKPPGTVEIQIVKVGKTNGGIRQGNRFEVFSAWLEGEPMH